MGLTDDCVAALNTPAVVIPGREAEVAKLVVDKDVLGIQPDVESAEGVTGRLAVELVIAEKLL
jgi:hypothetical protein